MRVEKSTQSVEERVITLAQVTHIKCIGTRISNMVKLFSSFYCSLKLWVEKFKFQKVKRRKKREETAAKWIFYL